MTHPPIKEGPLRHRWVDIIRDMEQAWREGRSMQESYNALVEAHRTNLNITKFQWQIVEAARYHGLTDPSFKEWIYRDADRFRLDDVIEDLEWMMRAGEHPEMAFRRLVAAGTYTSTPQALQSVLRRNRPDRADLITYLQYANDYQPTPTEQGEG